MKKALILLLATLAIVAIAYFCIYEKRIPAIEKDLLFRSQNNLNNQNMSWVDVEVEGRNLTLIGTAPSAEMRKSAHRIANINGVNFIDNQLKVDSKRTQEAIDKALSGVVGEVNADAASSHSALDSTKTNDAYELIISQNGKGKLLMEGVMSSAMHQKVMAEASAKMGVDQLIDRIIDKEVETPEVLPVIAETMLVRVSALEDGRARLTGNKLTVSGSSPTQEAIEQVKQQTENSLPEGFESSFNLTPPAVIAITAGSARLVKESSPENTKQETKKDKKITQISSKKCQKKFNSALKSSNIYFNSSSAVIKKSSYKVLKKIANVAGQCTSHKIRVHGHTDATGISRLNKSLSKKRAQAVVNYLVKKGVSPKHVRVIGHGSSKPVASNKTAEGRKRNRRIELTVED